MVIPTRTPSSEVYTCSFPGCPTPVVIRTSLIEVLQALVRDTEEDRQGLIHGETGASATELCGTRPLTVLSVDEMRKALADAPEPVVGYYRIRPGSSMVLTADEVAVADTVFTKPGSVVLLVERRDTGPEANCFFSEHGAFLNFPLLEFPLDSGVLAQREVQRQKRIAEEANKPAPALGDVPSETISDTPKPEPAPSNRRKLGWLIFAIIASALFISLSAGLFLNRRRVITTTAAPVSSLGSSRAPLRAERQGDDLKILWDLSSPAIASATSGVLEIVDGGTPRQIPMSADQVRFGSLLYSPISGQVSVRLTTLKDEQTTAQASVLVLLNRPTPGTPGSVTPASSTARAQVRPESSQSTTEAPSQTEIEGKAERRAATRAFVPPVDNTTQLQTRPGLPSLKADPLVLPMPFPSAPASAPALVANAGRDPVRPPEPAHPQAAPAPSLPVTVPARVEATKTPREDFVAPVLLRQGGVRTPPELPQIFKPVAIRVRVDLNEAGRVTRAEAVPEKGIHTLLLQAAVDAAWKCTFQPARQGQKPVPSSLVVVFHLGPQK